jgi:hypothetical protein
MGIEGQNKGEMGRVVACGCTFLGRRKMGRLNAQGAAITFFAWWRGISHEAGAASREGKPRPK